MANNLTGDFDVVAEFAILAVDRLLAGMHQTGRFLHSMSVRVDDNPHPTKPGWPVMTGVVDSFGKALADQRRIGTPNPFPSGSVVASATASQLGVLLNPDALTGTFNFPPSHISGSAQLQLFPPTVTVPDASGTNLTIRMNVICRFFPDKDTAPLAEFIRGDLQITAPINKIVSGNINVIDIDFKASQAIIKFTPSFSSQPLSFQDLAGINLCIQNGMRTSFLPSTVTLPNSIADVQLKTLPGAVVLMLDLNDHPSTPSSVTNVFLSADDDFAFAVGRDYLLNTLRTISNNILNQTFPPVKFTVDLTIWGVGTVLHYSYPISLSSANFDVQTGKIVLAINGHAGPEPNGHPPSSFNFTVNVEFSLATSGPAVELIVGNVSVSTDSSIAGIVDFFTGDVTNSVRSAIATAIANTGAGNTVSNMFDANTNLGNFLNTQLNPPGGSQNQSQQLFPVYTSVDIQPAGVVLHGSLLLFDWPAPYVEFEPIPTNGSIQQSAVFGGPDYSALNTWIPGGTIAQYQWHMGAQPPFDVDPNRFVLLTSPELTTGASVSNAVFLPPAFSPLCLTITGTRISNFGSPPTYQQISASICAYSSFPVITIGGLETGPSVSHPTLAITHAGAKGEVVVSSHIAPAVDQTGIGVPNLVVHFADAKSSTQLEILTKAIAGSHRKDAATAAMAVLTPEHLSKAPFVPGVVYAEDQDGSWLRHFGVKSAKCPLTLIVSPRGSVLWKSEGELHLENLTAALAKHLLPRRPVRSSLPVLNVRIGQRAPNFLFEYSPGHEMPITKLSGQSILLVFWKSAVKASIEAVRQLQNSSASSKSAVPVVLAVNDGDDPAAAKAVAKENGITAIVVTDPKREISRGYGVISWPTIISVDGAGIVRGIRYGYTPVAESTPPGKKPAAKS